MNTRNLDCLQKINTPLYFYIGIHKASYNHISKKFFTFQAEKSTTLCADRTKNIYPSTYTKEKSGTSMRRKTKKTYTSTHNETRGAVCIPASSYSACMYKSLNCPFFISIFIPRPRGCSILTQRFLFVQSERKNIFLCLLWSSF